MAPAASTLVARHSSLKVVPCSSSPDRPGWCARSGDRHVKGYAPAQAGIRAGQLTGLPNSNRSPAAAAAHIKAAALQSSQDATVGTAADDVDPETIRLMTAATILSASDAGSSSDDEAAQAALDEDDVDQPPSSTLPSALSLLDDLTVLDADSLSLVVGILRQHQPLDAEEVDVQLSERLRDLLVLLRQRPTTLGSSSAGNSRSASPTLGSSSSNESAAQDGGFWAAPDEWSDVRSALMSIGINASVDESDDEDVWTIEEEGPARRTRLLRRLPRLDTSTAAELASFLTTLQQRTGVAATARSTGSGSIGGSISSNGKSEAADRQQVVSEEEERWWEDVTQAYQLLWEQARLQQTK